MVVCSFANLNGFHFWLVFRATYLYSGTVHYWYGADRTTNKNYLVSANVKETADAAQRAIRSKLTCAAAIDRLASEELFDGQSDEIPQCYRPSRFSVLKG